MLSGEVRRRNECENDCAIHNKERRRSHFSSFGAFYLLAAAAAAVATVAVAIKSTDNLYLREQVFCDERSGRLSRAQQALNWTYKIWSACESVNRVFGASRKAAPNAKCIVSDSRAPVCEREFVCVP